MSGILERLGQWMTQVSHNSDVGYWMMKGLTLEQAEQKAGRTDVTVTLNELEAKQSLPPCKPGEERTKACILPDSYEGI